MGRKIWTDEKIFIRLLNNKSERTYWENIQELHHRCNDYVFAKSAELIKSNSQKARQIGVDALAQLGIGERPFEKETLQLYFDLLENESDAEVLMSILFAIGHNNYETLNDAQITLLATFKENKDFSIRWGLVCALLGVNKPKAVKTLIFLMNDKTATVRDWATFGIGTQIKKNTAVIRDALWNRVNDKDQDTKLEAIVGLATRKDARVKEIIERELLIGEFGTLLFEAIEELEDKSFLPLLKQNLKKYKNDKGIAEHWIVDLKNCINKLNKIKILN